MKAPALPIFALESFPQQPKPRKPYYIERLETHVAKFPGVSVPHAHDFYLLLYVTAGHGQHTIDLVPYELRAGSFFFMTPGQVHNWSLSEAARGFIVFFDADFYLFRYPGSRLYEYPFFDNAHAPVLYLPPDEPDFRLLFERMFAENASAYDNQAEVFRSYLYLSLELAARHYQGQPRHAPTHGQEQIRAFSSLLNQHFRTQRTVSEYADMLHITANHLNAVCRRLLNKTASALIQERVIVEAQRLLQYSSQTVAEVAYALGFEDTSYFSRYFRKHTGLTPEAFRLHP
ncbi:helix-turn-helix domain-containing protein [Hymenobacter sp. BT491]|uniref:helix-turn-helix domain-containing protein n=1 Tax=Hymenobacter sp. BT491 TaxID=2766779 RepID=UPI0016539FB7|nr:AraC family transcriptional regulator [Hymenobacter sp. BT491]MBC6990382.1 helix-turn-helix domain-containing protein [Hymenobacter sp. BT491]